MTLGETRVRTDFNVSGDTLIDEIKKETAKLINFCVKESRVDIHEEQARLLELAIQAYEEAAMWAVKAITYK